MTSRPRRPISVQQIEEYVAMTMDPVDSSFLLNTPDGRKLAEMINNVNMVRMTRKLEDELNFKDNIEHIINILTSIQSVHIMLGSPLRNFSIPNSAFGRSQQPDLLSNINMISVQMILNAVEKYLIEENRIMDEYVVIGGSKRSKSKSKKSKRSKSKRSKSKSKKSKRSKSKRSKSKKNRKMK